MVERRSFAEHCAHIRDVVDPPVVQRVVERLGTFEHPASSSIRQKDSTSPTYPTSADPSSQVRAVDPVSERRVVVGKVLQEDLLRDAVELEVLAVERVVAVRLLDLPERLVLGPFFTLLAGELAVKRTPSLRVASVSVL